MRRKTVLFVDDEAHVLSSLRRAMRNEPFDVLIALGGEKALELLESNPVDLVVSDQKMPGMTGSEFLQRVKERWPHTVRIILSGYSEVTTIMDAINRCEVRRFLGKPWNDENLKSTIRECLEPCPNPDDPRSEEKEYPSDTRLDTYEHRLSFSQEVMDWFPVPIIGINRSGMLMLVNQALRDRIPRLRDVDPGTPLQSALPEVNWEELAAILDEKKICVMTMKNGAEPIRLTAEPLSNEAHSSGWILFAEIV